MASADVFLFPSAEGGGMVVLEAMANGLPVVCLDYGGPGEMVTEDCGFRADLGGSPDAVTQMASSLSLLAKLTRPSAAGSGSMRGTSTYVWDNRYQAVAAWQRSVLCSHDKPKR